MEADLYKQKTWAHKIQAQEKNLSNIKIQILSDHKNSKSLSPADPTTRNTESSLQKERTPNREGRRVTVTTGR